nr:sigma 54-interacting transcriptional regulator [Desulfobacterales bacterium]
MKGLSLNTKLLIGISVLVVTSGMIIALVGSYHYSRALQEAAVSQGEYLSQSLALEATDMILINDIVALQKLIHHQKAINNPSVSYVFIEHDGRILAHTFEGGFPVALIGANQPRSASMGHHQSIEADSGDRYLDFAWPIFGGRAGTLRLGLSGQAIQKRVIAYWVKMIASALVVLAAALVAGAVIARKISGPVTRLAETADQIDAGKLDVAIAVTGADEIGRLGLAFSRMLTRIRDYTDRLEETSSDLDRAYRQTKSSFDILQKISTQTSLKDVCAYLFEQFQEIVACSRFMLVFFSPNQNDLIVFADGTLSLHSSDTALALLKPIRDRDDIFFARLDTLPPEIQPESFQNAGRIAVLPLTAETNPLGALMVACPGECQCNTKDLEVIDLILHEATGVLRRAIWHEAEKHQPGNHRKQMEPFEGMVGKAPEINIIFHIIKDIAPTDVSVLIQGQSGTGKELVAHAIHNLSERREKPFIVINCSAYPATLLESELFGHEKGAFT